MPDNTTSTYGLSIADETGVHEVIENVLRLTGRSPESAWPDLATSLTYHGTMPGVRRLTSLVRIGGGLLWTGLLVMMMVPILIILLPFRIARIYVYNAFGSAIGWGVLKCSGCRLTIVGREHVRADRPAIYVNNHTSILDAFTTIWLTPRGTVGVGKKEVIYYPFYGLAWWLAGQVLLDRGQTHKAKASIRRAAHFVKNNGLSLFILPEGTRSDSGRLIRFKKGVIHIALATKLPIVPMVTIGLQNAWPRSTLSLQPAEVRIIFLPPVETTHWTEEGIPAQVEQLRAPFLRTLPAEQRPE